MYLCTYVCRYTFLDMDMQCECVYSLVQHTQIEAKTYNVVQGEGIVAESKRSHLKRERKLPEKLRSIQMVDDDVKTYKRGLFEKRVAELVSPFTASRMPIMYTHTNTYTYTHTYTHRHTHTMLQVAFKQHHGHLNVSADKTSSFYVRHLGGWVNAQRRARKRGELPDHMVRSLDAIGFPWKIRRLSGENSLKQDSLHHDNVVLPPSIFQVTFDAEQM